MNAPASRRRVVLLREGRHSPCARASLRALRRTEHSLGVSLRTEENRGLLDSRASLNVSCQLRTFLSLRLASPLTTTQPHFFVIFFSSLIGMAVSFRGASLHWKFQVGHLFYYSKYISICQLHQRRCALWDRAPLLRLCLIIMWFHDILIVKSHDTPFLRCPSKKELPWQQQRNVVTCV